METSQQENGKKTEQEYVEVARGGVTNRGRVEELDDFKPSEDECY
jgi:hypothetical protein